MMMNVEQIAANGDVEEGELSDTSDEVYKPLQRPASLTHKATITAIPSANNITCLKMDSDVVNDEVSGISIVDDEDECQSEEYSSSSGDSSDTCLDNVNRKTFSKHKKRHVKRTVMVRVNTTSDSSDQRKTRFKKYDIWTAALQEDALTENMRGCDVTKSAFYDRNVENYDFSLKYRLNGANSLKRRLSNSNEDFSDSEQYQPHTKRQRPSSRDNIKLSSSKRPVHERLGKRRNIRERRRSSPNSGGSDSNSYDPRYIEDLGDLEGRDAADVGREMAMKLNEENDDLLVRVVEVLRTELPLKIYKETQRIEAEGGMTIKNGQRRRTPGGVFLFLLKHHDSLSAEDQKAIFSELRNNANKKIKDMKAIIRDRKVKELKKRLCEQGAELPNLNTRKDLMLLDELNQKENDGNLSNPPPSPEASEENELDLVSIPINHVNNDIEADVSNKPSTSQNIEKPLQTYDDDLLDVNCGDMDFF